MTDSIIVAIFTALLTGVGALIIRWMNDIESHIKKITDVSTELTQLTQRIDSLEKTKIDTLAYGIQPQQLVEIVKALSQSVKEFRSRIARVVNTTNRLQNLLLKGRRKDDEY